MKPRGIILAIVAVAAATVPYPAPPEPDLTSLPRVELRSALPPPRPREKPGFLSFALDNPQAFIPLIGSNPERICDRLDEAGFANLGWRGAEISGVWECMARLEEAPLDIFQDNGEEEEAGEGIDVAVPPAKENSLFYLLRGTSRQRLAYARMKLNLLEPQNEDEMLGRAREFLAALADAAGFRLPQEVIAAVHAKQPVTVRTKEATFRLKPEFDDPRRFNLSIEFAPDPRAFHQSEYRTADAAQDKEAEDGTASAGKGGNIVPDNKTGRLQPGG